MGFLRLGIFDFNVIAVLSSLFPSQRFPLFAFLSQLSLILFSVLSFSGELNGGLVWAQSYGQNRNSQHVRRYVVLPSEMMLMSDLCSVRYVVLLIAVLCFFPSWYPF